MEENISNRLKRFIDHSGITDSQFADTCGISRSTLSMILTGRNKKISDVLIGQIHAVYPQLSILWLMFGEGEMYTEGIEQTPSLANPQKGDESGERSSSFTSAANYTGSADGEMKLNESCNSNSSMEAASNISVSDSPLSQVSANAVLAADLKSIALMKQIENMKQNPRRVVQITIYYDDSTFETFTPQK